MASAKLREPTAVRWALRLLAVGYVFMLVAWPTSLIFKNTFADGFTALTTALYDPTVQHALKMTAIVALSAVVINTVFGVGMSLLLVRHHFPGKRALSALIDLPMAVSPIVVGLALLLVYGRIGWFGPELAEAGIQIIFSLPGIVLATIFVSLPFVVREVAPVLREIGTDQEQAAQTLGANGWQAFRRITLPAIRWGLVYGVVLSTARALGEFGAVSIVSGKVSGETETLTLLVEKRFQNFDLAGAYAASTVLALLALATLLAMTLLDRRRDRN